MGSEVEALGRWVQKPVVSGRLVLEPSTSISKPTRDMDRMSHQGVGPSILLAALS